MYGVTFSLYNVCMELFSVQFGSRLYGTQTPTSDLDMKVVVLPPIDEVLYGTKLVNKVKQTRTGPGKNTADDIDLEEIPLQIFAKDFLGGQTYALEIAFSIDGEHAGQKMWPSPVDKQREAWPFYQATGDRKHLLFYHFVRELRSSFMTSNVKAMVGYAVHQANLYSLKGERLNVLEETTLKINSIATAYLPSVKLEEVHNFRLVMGYTSKYFRFDQYEYTEGKFAPCFVLLEKTFPLSITIEEAQKRLVAMRSQYGERARQASETNVDWKALMHAVRVSIEAEELLSTRHITLPFTQGTIDYLLSIKRGEQPLGLVKDELNDRLERIKDLQKSSSLPELTDALQEKFKVWLTHYLRLFYNI
jgi:hypothetical protein